MDRTHKINNCTNHSKYPVNPVNPVYSGFHLRALAIVEMTSNHMNSFFATAITRVSGASLVSCALPALLVLGVAASAGAQVYVSNSSNLIVGLSFPWSALSPHPLDSMEIVVDHVWEMTEYTKTSHVFALHKHLSHGAAHAKLNTLPQFVGRCCDSLWTPTLKGAVDIHAQFIEPRQIVSEHGNEDEPSKTGRCPLVLHDWVEEHLFHHHGMKLAFSSHHAPAH